MKCYTDTLAGTCGLNVFFEFEGKDDDDGWGHCGDEIEESPLGGIGYSIAGFVDNLTCKKAYKTIKKHFEIVYQSPVKLNANSNNMFFFIVFKRKES